jgi:hypothetical protein
MKVEGMSLLQKQNSSGEWKSEHRVRKRERKINAKAENGEESHSNWFNKFSWFAFITF